MHLGRKCEPGVSWVVPIQQMYLAPQVEGQRPTGLSKGGDPAQQHTLLSNDTSACPGVLRPDPSCPTTDHQCSQMDTGHPHSARVRERSSDSLV